MTIGGSAQSAPFGLSGSVAIVGGLALTRAVKAIDRPSGAQAMPEGGCSSAVSVWTWSVSSQSTHSWVEPGRSETKAIREPSGDQRGAPSPNRPVVRGRWPVPSTPTTHRLA
jgi:hypothetical protein